MKHDEVDGSTTYCRDSLALAIHQQQPKWNCTCNAPGDRIVGGKGHAHTLAARPGQRVVDHHQQRVLTLRRFDARLAHAHIQLGALLQQQK